MRSAAARCQRSASLPIASRGSRISGAPFSERRRRRRRCVHGGHPLAVRVERQFRDARQCRRERRRLRTRSPRVDAPARSPSGRPARPPPAPGPRRCRAPSHAAARGPASPVARRPPTARDAASGSASACRSCPSRCTSPSPASRPRQSPHQRMLRAPSAARRSPAHRDHGRQRFRYRRHGQADGRQQHQHRGSPRSTPGAKTTAQMASAASASRRPNARAAAAAACGFAGRLDQARDAAELGVATGCHDDAATASVGDDRAVVRHVAPVARVGAPRPTAAQRPCPPARTRRSAPPPPRAVRRLAQPQVGGHAHARLEGDHVAGHELRGRQVTRPPPADRLRARSGDAGAARHGRAAALVVRGGGRVDLPAAELVPGDVVCSRRADRAGGPAAGRGGEPADRRGGADRRIGAGGQVDGGARRSGRGALGDRRNIAYKGTHVTYGRGRGVVVATGMRTEFGRIARLLVDACGRDRTPLQQRLAVFGRRLALAVLGICAIVFAVGLLRGEPALLMLLTARQPRGGGDPGGAAGGGVDLAGARRAARWRGNALIRRLPAVETLGSVTVDLLGQDRHADAEPDARGRATAARRRAERGRRRGRMLLRRWRSATTPIARAPTASWWATRPRWRCCARRATAGFDNGGAAQAAAAVAELPFDSDAQAHDDDAPAADGVRWRTQGRAGGGAARGAAPAPTASAMPSRPARSADGERWRPRACACWRSACGAIAACPRYERRRRSSGPRVRSACVGLIDPPRPEARRGRRRVHAPPASRR